MATYRGAEFVTEQLDSILAQLGDGDEVVVVDDASPDDTVAVVRGRPCFHVALACDISPYCDCYALNDAPILEDIGMFASFDPVAMDQCCVDMANARKPLRNSLLYQREKPGAADHFTALFPETNWQAGLEQGEKLGIGTREYEMEEMA